jgi:hypothetical protein
MFSHTDTDRSLTRLQQDFFTSRYVLTDDYSAKLSQFVIGSRYFNTPARVIILILRDFQRYQLERQPNHMAPYYFWVRNVLEDMDSLVAKKVATADDYNQLIIAKINAIDPAHMSFDSGLGKLLASVIKFYPDYFLQIKPELLKKMQLTAPYNVDWKQLFKHMFTISQMRGVANQEYCMRVFDISKSFFSSEQLQAFYKEIRCSGIEYILPVLRALPPELFATTYRYLLERCCDYVNDLYKFLKISDAFFDSLEDELVLLLYQLIIKIVEKNPHAQSAEKLKILVKYIDKLPESLTKYLTEQRNHTKLFEFFHSAISYTENAMETSQHIKRMAEHIENFYPRFFNKYYNHHSNACNFLQFATQNVVFIPHELKLWLLIHGSWQMYRKDFFAIACAYNKALYLSLDFDTRKEFENYIFATISKFNRASLENQGIRPEVMLFANFLSYAKHPTEAIPLVMQYYHHFSDSPYAFAVMMDGFFHQGIGFLPAAELMVLADFILPFLNHQTFSYKAANFLRSVYNELPPVGQLVMQQNLTPYLKDACALADDLKCLFALTDLGFVIKACNKPEVMDSDFEATMHGAVERLFMVMDNLQVILLSSNDKDEIDMETLQELQKYHRWSRLSFDNYAHFITTEQKNHYFQQLVEYVCHPQAQPAVDMVDYLVARYHDYDTALQEMLFSNYAGPGLSVCIAAFNRLYLENSNSFDDIAWTLKDLYSLCLNKDESLNHHRVIFVIDQIIALAFDAKTSTVDDSALEEKGASDVGLTMALKSRHKLFSPLNTICTFNIYITDRRLDFLLLFFCEMIGIPDQEYYKRYALIKLTEVQPTAENTNFLIRATPILSASLYSISYQRQIKDNLRDDLKEKSIGSLVIKFL